MVRAPEPRMATAAASYARAACSVEQGTGAWAGVQATGVAGLAARAPEPWNRARRDRSRTQRAETVRLRCRRQFHAMLSCEGAEGPSTSLPLVPPGFPTSRCTAHLRREVIRSQPAPRRALRISDLRRPFAPGPLAANGTWLVRRCADGSGGMRVLSPAPSPVFTCRAAHHFASSPLSSSPPLPSPTPQQPVSSPVAHRGSQSGCSIPWQRGGAAQCTPPPSQP